MLAAKLGLGRAALLRNDDQQGIAALKEVIFDPQVHSRDRELAAYWLGEHFLSIGNWDEAVRAFDTYADERATRAIESLQ